LNSLLGFTDALLQELEGSRNEEQRRQLRPVCASARLLDKTIDAGIPAEMTVLSNERALTRLLINLVSSAISFAEAGGVQILGIMSDGVGTARVDVIDRGVGLPELERERLFEPFGRGPLARARPEEGPVSDFTSAVGWRISSGWRSSCRAGRAREAGSA
jgi:signal transduction histidine kinase